MAEFRAAIVGCGSMARSHQKALAQMPEVAVVALADRRPEALASFAELVPEAKTYEHLQDLLAAEPLDLISIVTTGPAHAPLTILAAEAGVPAILCEKPMACCLTDARQMIEACERHGTRLGINHVRRWSSTHQRLRDALADGLIGRPRSYLCSLGAGRMGCNASHIVDLVRMVSEQEIVDVCGWVDTTGTPDPRGGEFTDPGGHALMHLADGSRFYLDQMEDLGVPPAVDIVGSIGRMRIEEGTGVWEARARREADRDQPMLSYGCPLEPVPFDPGDGLATAQVAAYRNLLNPAEPVRCSGWDGYRAVEAVMAIHLSDGRDHRPVSLPLSGEDLDLRINFT